MRRNFTLLLLAAFSFLHSIAQHTSFTLQGTIRNAVTGEPVSYATIRLVKNGINTMSNEEGRFLFKIPSGNNKDTIYISHVGYRTSTVVLNEQHNNTIFPLQPEAAQLAEVVVKTINPVDLIQQAIAKIPDNYPSKPFLCTGFYRLTGRKVRNIMDISETVFDIYADNYEKKNKQIRLIKARLDKDLTAFNGSDNIDIGIKPESILNNDIVSSPEGTFLDKDVMKDYRFTFHGAINYNGREAYEILFDQKDGVKKALFKGKMLIDADNLAFLSFVYALSPKGIQYWQLPGWGNRTMMKLANIRLKILLDSSCITYQQYGDKYYLNHVSGVTHYYLASNRFEFNPMANRFNFLITKIDTANVAAFTKKETLSNRSMFESYSPEPDSTEDAFWADYNMILADYNVDSAIKVIRANNETLNYKRALQTKLVKFKGDYTARIDSILSFYYHKDQFNGVALVKYADKVSYKKGVGLADKEKSLPNTMMTAFRIGSMSKQFTAMLIMQLVNENKLRVTDSAGKFLSGYTNGSVTIQQLLTHQSGIPNYTENDDYKGAILSQRFSTEELVKKFCSDPLEFTPGEQFHYSNSGYVILAAIVEKVTGKKFGEVLAEKVFIPAGMTHSFFGTVANAATAKGYSDNTPEIIYPLENVTGAGGITSTAEDLLLWSEALSSYKLLPKEATEELFKVRVEWGEWEAGYGYGWMIDHRLFKISDKRLVQYHPGTELGMYAMLVRVPDKNITIILLNNTGDFPRFDMTDLLLSELDK
ncbi:MAG: serine hydrolase [Chitinophagaceae bacterium]